MQTVAAGKPMEIFMNLVTSDANATLFKPIGHDPKVRKHLQTRLSTTDAKQQLKELTTVSFGPALFGMCGVNCSDPLN